MKKAGGLLSRFQWIQETSGRSLRGRPPPPPVGGEEDKLRFKRFQHRLRPDSPDTLFRSANAIPDPEEKREAPITNSREEITKNAFRPVDVPPETTSILLFPGQGAQFVGMGREVISAPHAQELFERASEILKLDLLQICLEGPSEELNRTEVCQTAIYVTSLAAVQKLKTQDPDAILRCVGAAGMSVGEYAALAFAGSLGFEDGVRLLKERGRLMQQASEETPSGMLSVAVSVHSQLPEALLAAKEFARSQGVEVPVCSIATHLFTQFRVIGGNELCLQFLEKYGKTEYKLGGMKRLPVSGAFHTPIMEPAAVEFREALKSVKFKEPLIPVHSNFDGKRFPDSPKEITRQLYKSLFRPVKWEQTMKILTDRAPGTRYPRIFEVGPGTQLRTILSKTNLKAGARVTCVKC